MSLQFLLVAMLLYIVPIFLDFITKTHKMADLIRSLEMAKDRQVSKKFYIGTF